LTNETTKAVRMDATPWQREMPLISLNSQEDLKQWAIGCDRDIGGFSEAHLEITPEGKGRFYGNISLDLPSNPEIVRSGYAAIRSKQPSFTLFGTPTWDTSLYRYLGLRIKGDQRKYFVNIQTDGVVETDLYQHRLFTRHPGEWETVLIPFRDFILTNNAEIQEQQVIMLRERVKTVGVSIMDQRVGKFSLELDWIKAINSNSTEGDLDRQ